MGIPYAQTYQTVRIEAASAEELRRKVAGYDLAPGSTGTLELYARRTLGVCLIPIDFVGSGGRLKDKLEEAGVIVTDMETFGGIPGHRCDLRIFFAVPEAAPSDYATPGAFFIPALVIVGAVVLLALALSLLVFEFTALVKEIGKQLGPFAWILWVGVGLGIGALAIKSFRGKRRS